MVTPLVVDVNVLVAAQQPLHPLHEVARTWLGARLADPSVPAYVPDLVWVGFVRVTTNHHAFSPPATPEDAAAFVRAVARAPAYRRVSGLRADVTPFLDLVVQSSARGNLVTDAYIASVALQFGAAVATFDRDFRRFDGLRLVTPAAP